MRDEGKGPKKPTYPEISDTTVTPEGYDVTTRPIKIAADVIRLSGLTNPETNDPTTEVQDDQKVARTYEVSDMTDKEFAALKPGDIINIGEKSCLTNFETLIESKLLTGGDWSSLAKWSSRESIKNLVKPEKVKKTPFFGNVTDITAQVMDNPGAALITASNYRDKKAGIFIKGEKLPYKVPEGLMDAVRNSTIGFIITANISSTAGLHGTAQLVVWYTGLELARGRDIRRSMTKPIGEIIATTSPDASPKAVDPAITTRGGIWSEIVPNKSRTRRSDGEY